MRKAANSYGDYDRHWDGFDMTFQARLRAGLNIQGGTSTGRLVGGLLRRASERARRAWGCRHTPVWATYSSLLNPYCKQVEPFSTTYKANASYLVPKIDVQVSGTFSSRPGAILRADAILPGQRSDDSRHARPSAGGGGAT